MDSSALLMSYLLKNLGRIGINQLPMEIIRDRRDMKASIFTYPILGLCWVLLLWPFACAQFEEGQIPACASTCTYGAFYSPDCKDKDYLCLCKDPTMLSFLIPCTGAMCEPFEIDQTVSAVQEVCAAVGVSLSITTTWSIAQSSTATPTTYEPSHHPSGTPNSWKTLRTSTVVAVTTTLGSDSLPSNTSTAFPHGEASSSSKLSTGAISGIAVGVILPVVALVILFFVLSKRRYRKLGVPILPASKSHETDRWGGIGPDNDVPGQVSEVK
ncbi:hypothetical protein TWF506_009241 [Arthrobotrys conoides]|uniref:CFEM domain-containing protein n=1 Tax=Arthrobotrys conoides TaxID=74498 RepID=A0AAN8NUU9_9PEZI